MASTCVLERSSTTFSKQVHSFGTMLSPVHFSAQERLTSELLRTLLRMAASRQTSWLSLHSHLLSHCSPLIWGTLAGGLGCFPFDDEALSPHRLTGTVFTGYSEFDSIWYRSPQPATESVLYPPSIIDTAVPQHISRRTS